MDKKLFLGFSGVIILVLMALLVSAITQVTIDSPSNDEQLGNKFLNLTATVTGSTADNVTFQFINSTGDNVYNVTITNSSTDQSVFTNVSFNSSVLLNGGPFNITIVVANDTDTVSALNNVSGLTIDNLPPNVTILAPASSTNVKGNSVLLNSTVGDSHTSTGTVIFNITNSTGGHVATATASNPSQNNWNATFDSTALVDGLYNVTVIANDTLGNQNKTEATTLVKIDNTKPGVSLAKNTGSSSKSTLVIDVTISESGSGMSSSCSVYVSGSKAVASISGTGTAQTVTLTGINNGPLGCGTSHQITVTCTDAVGNTGVPTSDSFLTDSCSGGNSLGSGGGSSSTATSWTNTFVVSGDLSTETREFSAKQRVKLNVNGATHHVGVLSLTTTSAVIQIASDPVEATFNIGETKKFDLNEDGTYDLSVTLNGIANNKADLTITAISEVIPEGTEDGTEATDDTETGGEETSEEVQSGVEETGSGLGTTAWVVIAIVVIIVVVLAVLLTRKKK